MARYILVIFLACVLTLGLVNATPFDLRSLVSRGINEAGSLDAKREIDGTDVDGVG